MKGSRVCVAAAGVMLAAGHVMAGGPEMWAWYSTDDSLWAVDSGVPSVANIGPTQSPIVGVIAEIEYGNGVIYGSDTGINTMLHVIDPNTGVVASTLTMTFPPQGNAITSMEFAGGALYAGLTTEGGGETYLSTINLATGVISVVGGASGIGSPTGGLAFDGNTMYAISSGGSTPTLYTINLLTGVATPVGPVLLPGAVSPGGMTALEFGVDGLLYGLTNVLGTGMPLAGHLLRINPADASAVDLGDMANTGLVSLTSAHVGCPPVCEGDADGNGVVNVNDITFVVFRLGNACP